jgi:hypothetical protein
MQGPTRTRPQVCSYVVSSLPLSCHLVHAGGFSFLQGQLATLLFLVPRGLFLLPFVLPVDLLLRGVARACVAHTRVAVCPHVPVACTRVPTHMSVSHAHMPRCVATCQCVVDTCPWVPLGLLLVTVQHIWLGVHTGPWLCRYTCGHVCGWVPPLAGLSQASPVARQVHHGPNLLVPPGQRDRCPPTARLAPRNEVRLPGTGPPWPFPSAR